MTTDAACCHTTGTPVAALPLTGVRVLDLTDGKGETTARLLADLGADVIRVEPTTGAASRTQEPVHNGASLYYATHNANKRAVALDLTSDAGRDRFLHLLDTADILVESSRPGELEMLGLAPTALREHNPALVVVSVTDFGRSGPYRDWVATEWVHLAMGGVLSRSGLPGMTPLLPPGSMALESAAIQAAWAALLAYMNRLQTGLGDHVDLSVYEATAQVFDPGYGIGGSATGGVPAAQGPRGRPDARHLYPIFPCADGWVRICVLSPRQWQGMFAWLGEPEEFADPALASLGKRFAAADRIYPAIGRMFATKTRDDIVAEGQRFGVPTAALLGTGEVLSAEHFIARETFIAVPVGKSDLARIPNGFLEIDGHRAGVRYSAPTHGQHTDEVLRDLAVRGQGDAHRAPSPTPVSRRRPLQGLRVLDLGVIVVGAELGRLFADMGAEVIKVENRAFPDGGRQSLTGDAMTASFAWGHRNKLGLGLNLRDPRGVAVFRQLVAKSDVVLSNFKPGTMESLGLGYAALSAVNPGIVVADSSAFGPTGPWSRRMGYGPLVRSATGLSGLWKYPEGEGSFSDASTIYPDHVAARVGAVGVLAALIRRLRTGLGGSVSVAQAETILGQLADLLALESVAPGSVTAVGNDGQGEAPRGVFPCAGDDEWCVVTIRDDADWARLSAVIGRPELSGDPRFATTTARVAHRDEVDTMLTGWTLSHPPREAMALLQQAEVPAGMMQRVTDYPADPQLTARGFFRSMTHPHIAGSLPSENTPAHFTGVADPDLRPAPLPGEHTRVICMRVLGMSEQAIDELIADGVLEQVSAEQAATAA